nr:hypothetical protein CFP56_61920 [Quercus suber]
MSLSSLVVIKGPSPSTQVHLRAEDFGGSHGGHMEKFEFIWAWLRFWFWELGPSYVGTEEGRRVFFIGNIGVVVLRLKDVIMIEVFKQNLGGPTPSSIVKGPKNYAESQCCSGPSGFQNGHILSSRLISVAPCFSKLGLLVDSISTHGLSKGLFHVHPKEM